MLPNSNNILVLFIAGETRVGYMAAGVLYDLTMEYIRAHCGNGIYTGNVSYLTKAMKLRRYLEDGK